MYNISIEIKCIKASIANSMRLTYLDLYLYLFLPYLKMQPPQNVNTSIDSTPNTACKINLTSLLTHSTFLNEYNPKPTLMPQTPKNKPQNIINILIIILSAFVTASYVVYVVDVNRSVANCLAYSDIADGYL